MSIFQVRKQAPIIHCYTNMVTVNQVANALLAIGAKPIMSQAPQECQTIASISQALYVNIGTLSYDDQEAMLQAVQIHGQLGHPIVLDPVGAGASDMRTHLALQLLGTGYIRAVRGNVSEIKHLLGWGTVSAGVDVTDQDASHQVQGEALEAARALAQRFHTLVAISGAQDIIHDGQMGYIVSNGHEMMKYVTGTGCQLTAVITAFLAIEPTVSALLKGLVVYDLAGQIGVSQLGGHRGPGSLQVAIFDALYHMTDSMVDDLGNWEEVKENSENTDTIEDKANKANRERVGYEG